ncbi:MAG: hypothetical protein ACP5EQ_00460 [Candidatus Cloacimonadia bacterium]
MDVKELIQQIKTNIEKTANTTAVFGEIKKIGNISIIPVASIRLKGGGGGGFGEPSGSEKPEQPQKAEKPEKEEPVAKGKGGGLGLKVDAEPVGYIEIKGDEARFVEVVNKTKLYLRAIKYAGIFFVLIALKGIFSRRKK